MWKALRHPNTLPLIGVTMTDTQFMMVSEWMVNGNINEFVKIHTDADRLGLVRFLLEVLSFHFLLITARFCSWEMSVGGWIICTVKK